MAEESQVNGQEGQEAEVGKEVVSNNTPAQHEYSDVEKRAMAQGWVPEDQYTGSGKWRSAEEFLDRGELFSKIDEQNRKLRATEATLEALKAHHKKVAETEYKRAIAALKAEKKAALDEGDNARVVEIDDEIANKKMEAEKEIQKIEARPPVDTAPNPQFVAWVNRNPWYTTDKAMKIFADTIGDEMVAEGVRNPSKILEEVEKRVKEEFAHKFTNPKRNAPGAVEGGGNKGSQRGEAFQLTTEETQVMNKLVKHGVMTREEYIAEVKAMRKEAQ